MDRDEDGGGTPVWKDPKQGGILATLALLGGIISSAGYQVIDRKDAFTQHDFDREKATLTQYADAKHAELAAKIKAEMEGQVRDEMRVIRDEITRNRSRLDQLLETTAKMSALVEQRMIYSRQVKGYGDPNQNP